MSQRHGAIAAGHPLTVEAGAEVLAEGGNAFDAAIAALWMACVCEPVLASPGGGGFLTALSADRPAGGQSRVFDFFPATPAARRREDEIEFAEIEVDFGTARQAFHVGAGASAVPGFVPGLFAVHEALGSVPMRRLAEPAINAARTGVEIRPLQAYLLQVVEPICRWTAGAEALFTLDGKLPQAGAVMRNGDLGEAIDAIAREGPRIATEGEIAAAMASVSTDHGGHLSAQDLRSYAVELRAPIPITAGGYEVRLNPPPALGGALVAAMLARLDSGAAEDHIGRARAVDEVDRFWREAPTDPGRLLGGAAPRPAQATSRGTTHVSVIDRQGNAAAATVSNGEGNGRPVPGCGFMLNNILGEDDLNPDGFHRWRTATRLGSMMAPCVAVHRDGAVVALGSGGSNRIRTAILQVIANRCLAGMPIAEAIEAPRLHVERGRLDFEDLFPGGVREALTAAFPDHLAWPERNLYFGG
ncbi:gamma-glutamyltransferase, partial [Microbaculum marinum]